MATLIIWLIVSIGALLFLVLKWKVNASIALIVASLIMGIGTGLPLLNVIEGISEGFGSFMKGSGLPIGFGIILGQLVYDYGGANAIARGILKAFPKQKALYALALASFIISIPVFFDITFVLLIPLGIAMAHEIKKPLPYVVCALVAGGVITHTLVPPTPAPLAAAHILKFDVGLMILAGSIIGLIAAMAGMTFMFKLLDRGLWKPETDEADTAHDVTLDEPLCADRPTPGLFVSMVPILVPVVLILINTFYGMAVGPENIPLAVTFLGDKTISMLLGTVAAMIIALKNLSLKEIDISANNSLKSAGVVLLVTGAGGAFGKILAMSGLGDAITDGISAISAGPATVMIITFLIAMLLRVAQGSATVAGITTLNILAPAMASLPLHPLWVAVAGMAGAFSVGHVNDSGFWIMVNRSNFSVKGGLKVITLTELVCSLVILACAVVAGSILPTF